MLPGCGDACPSLARENLAALFVVVLEDGCRELRTWLVAALATTSTYACTFALRTCVPFAKTSTPSQHHMQQHHCILIDLCGHTQQVRGPEARTPYQQLRRRARAGRRGRPRAAWLQSASGGWVCTRAATRVR